MIAIDTREVFPSVCDGGFSTGWSVGFYNGDSFMDRTIIESPDDETQPVRFPTMDAAIEAARKARADWASFLQSRKERA